MRWSSTPRSSPAPSSRPAITCATGSGLESALARPQTYAHYENADLALQAAVLAHGIAESQTFVDGNKRLALVAMLTFLEINDRSIDASDAELAEWIISLSQGITPEQLAARIRGRLRPLR